MNPMLLIDGYKLDHRRQYPIGTQGVYSNWTPRESRIPGQKDVVFFGLQYFLDHYLGKLMNEYFFCKPRGVIEKQYKDRVDGYLGPNSIGTRHIAELHELGYVPLDFRAMPEGTLCPIRVPMVTKESTHPDFFWLVNYFETLMSNILWMPCTSATSAHRMRKMLNVSAKETGGDLGFVQWQGHDFSMRGMPGIEAAIISGAGHLLSFTGTDTIPAIEFVETYYQGDDNGLIGGSVPATEHSISSAGGKDNEIHTLSRILDLYPEGIVSFVSDTWDLWSLITKGVASLKDKIMSRNGKLVLRPDSGDPVDIICGDKSAHPDSPAYRGVVELLWNIFGGTRNSVGCKQLDSHIGVIYGDAITYDRAKAICERLKKKNFSSTNVVFGIGSYTYQFVTRDVYGFAVKATSAIIDGKAVDLFKKPVTDSGTKFSARGRLAVYRQSDGTLVALDGATKEQEEQSVLQTVWKNGEFYRRQSFADVRKTLWG